MKNIEIFITVTITMLSIAYPILLQVIARLDEKYSSIHIVELFDKEISKKWFMILLVSSLVSVCFWSFELKPLVKINGLNWVICNSANLLVFATSTALIIVFFFYVKKILIYYTPAKFINYLIANHNKKDLDLKYFNALADVFLLSVQKQNYNISQHISRFLYDDFRQEREKFVSNPVIYPESYYSLVYRTIEELAILNDKKDTSLEYMTSGGALIIGDLPDSEISELSYNWLWRNMLLMVKYKQDDMFLYHWQQAHQYFSFTLYSVDPEHNFETGELINRETIQKRDQERTRFLEYHYALGGLLLYKNRYRCIQRIFNYTTSQPPRYVLLPDHMDEIFNRYIEFRDTFRPISRWITTKYWFPDQNGINAEGVVNFWICKYLAILFLRQYTIIPYLITTKPIEFPNFPDTQSEKKKWIDNLDFFKELVSEILDNFNLIETLKLNFLTKDWCENNSKIYPLEYLDKLKEELCNKYEDEAINQSISDAKVSEFNNSTLNIVEKTYRRYSMLNNKSVIAQEYNKWFVNGLRTVISKDTFSEKPEIHHCEFDSFLASALSDNIKEGITSTFLYTKTKSYLMKPEDLFNAVEKLCLNDDMLIISIGINLTYYINSMKVNGLSPDKFKKNNIISLPSSRSIDPSIFIINIKDLPTVESKDIEPKVIEKYTLKNISTDFYIYTSVLDLNKASDEIRIENTTEKTEEELKIFVLLSIIQSTEIRWKKGIELVQIIEYSKYRQKGLPNSLSDIASFPIEKNVE